MLKVSIFASKATRYYIMTSFCLTKLMFVLCSYEAANIILIVCESLSMERGHFKLHGAREPLNNEG